MRTALVRRPGPRPADGLVSQKLEGCVTCLSVRIRVPLGRATARLDSPFLDDAPARSCEQDGGDERPSRSQEVR